MRYKNPKHFATVPVITITELVGIIANLADWVFNFAIVIAVIMVIIGGAFFVTGGGDPNRVATGKKILTWTVIGLFLALIAKGIFAVIENFFIP
jgi:hypothetical protein